MSPEEFDLYVQRLESFGFRVYQNPRSHFLREAVFTDGRDIGRMEAGNDAFHKGVILSTVCYPHRTAKTGYRLQDHRGSLSLGELTEAKAREAFALTPSWMKEVPEGLHKYDSFEHWKRHSFLAKKYCIPGPRHPDTEMRAAV